MELDQNRMLDAKIAEYVFKWLTIDGPDYDYYGKVEAYPVLIPPDSNKKEAYSRMPFKGVVVPYYFVPEYSKNISTAWEVVEAFTNYELSSVKTLDGERVYCELFKQDNGKIYSGQYISTTPALAICKAALKAYGVEF